MKTKLLIATDCFFPRYDGIARFLLEIIPRLEDEYDITVIAPKYEGIYGENEKIKVLRIPLSRFQFGDFKPAVFEFKKIKQEIRDADLIFVQSIGPIGMLAIKYGKEMGKSLIAYTHSLEWELVSKSLSGNIFFGSFLYKITRQIARKAYNKCDLLVVPSKEIAEILKFNGIKTKKAVVRIGTDTTKFVPSENKEEAKQKIGINPQDIVIGYCGRIAREKNIMMLYRTFLRVRKQYPHTKLLIVGAGIKKYQQILEANRNVIVTGFVDNVVTYLQAMDIFVLPSFTETSSLATIEAMSCGLPVISTKVGYLTEYIKEKQNGMTFPKGNSIILYEKLRWLLESQELREKLGKNARETAVKMFSWEKTAASIKEIIDMYSI